MAGIKPSTIVLVLVLVLTAVFLVVWAAGLPQALAPAPATSYYYNSSGGAVGQEAPREAPPPVPPADPSTDADDYPDEITAGNETIHVAPGAWTHLLGEHGWWTANILLAIDSGACLPQLYLPCGMAGLIDGLKGYFVCPGMHDEYGRARNGVVPVRWNGLTGRWEVMTAFYAQSSYLHSALLQDGCIPPWLQVPAWLGAEVPNDDD